MASLQSEIEESNSVVEEEPEVQVETKNLEGPINLYNVRLSVLAPCFHFPEHTVVIIQGNIPSTGSTGKAIPPRGPVVKVRGNTEEARGKNANMRVHG